MRLIVSEAYQGWIGKEKRKILANMGIISAIRAKIERAISALELIANRQEASGAEIGAAIGNAKNELAHLIQTYTKAEAKRRTDDVIANTGLIRAIEALTQTNVSRFHDITLQADQQVRAIETVAAALGGAARQADIRNGVRRLSIVFFMQSTSVWPSWQSFWEACASDPRIDATMVLTPSCYPDRELAWLDEVRDFLIKNDIGFITAEAYQLDRFRPDVAILQLPYTDSLPQHLQLPQLDAAGVRTVYIPYGLEIGGGGLNYRYQFDLPAHRTAWRIFARSVRHKRMYAKYCRSGSGHVVVAGHPKLDLQFRPASRIADEDLVRRIAGRRAVFWNPHFSVQNPPAWSTFDVFKDSILDAFSARPDLFLIARPHPLLFAGLLRGGFWKESDEAAFRKRIGDMENCYLDEKPDYQTAFSLSDAMLTDAGSFVLEYFATGRPLLQLRNPDGFGLNDDASIQDSLYVASTADEICAFLDMLLAGEDPKKAERESAIPVFLDGLDGRAGERIRDHIYEAFLKDDEGAPADVDVAGQVKIATNHQQMSDEELAELEQALEQLLSSFDPALSALHIGCADGRLTKIVSRHAKFTHAIDADAALITQAQAAAAKWGGEGKVTFGIESFDGIASCGVYDLIVCVDVLSSLVSNQAIVRHVDTLVAMMKTGAHLIIGDMLTRGQSTSWTEGESTMACRNSQQYLMMFKRRGLTVSNMVTSEENVASGAARTLFVLRKS